MYSQYMYIGTIFLRVFLLLSINIPVSLYINTRRNRYVQFEAASAQKFCLAKNANFDTMYSIENGLYDDKCKYRLTFKVMGDYIALCVA